MKTDPKILIRAHGKGQKTSDFLLMLSPSHLTVKNTSFKNLKRSGCQAYERYRYSAVFRVNNLHQYLHGERSLYSESAYADTSFDFLCVPFRSLKSPAGSSLSDCS